MCRFLIYKGSDEILLSKVILNPSHSILHQSYDSRLRLDTRRPHNGDGFGIGYYTDIKLGPEPCLFTSTLPAWNCINLERMAAKTESSLIFAHVRATTEGSLSDDNCHPFSCGSLMWMHNGGLGAWKHIKRALGQRVRDRWYINVHGSTDSEWAFALFLNQLENLGINPTEPKFGSEGFGPTVLRATMLATIATINELIKNIPEQVIIEENVDCRSLLNFAVSDGHSVVCSRYVSSKTDEAASLYYSSGSSWEDKKTKGNYRMERKDKGSDVVLIASEPLTFERDNWVTVPTNSIITIHKQTVMIHPIIDEYYNPSPDFKRSSKLVISKGLDTNEQQLTPDVFSGSPVPSPSASNEMVYPPMNSRTQRSTRPVIENKGQLGARRGPGFLKRVGSMVGSFRFKTSKMFPEDKFYTNRVGKSALSLNFDRFRPGANNREDRESSVASCTTPGLTFAGDESAITNREAVTGRVANPFHDPPIAEPPIDETPIDETPTDETPIDAASATRRWAMNQAEIEDKLLPYEVEQVQVGVAS